ncbi:MAG TPA: hypothetical protein VMW52_10845 [Phycisphaerae bacterium]|nr:hypothetical protein [Phycisphaerae bacterium]
MSGERPEFSEWAVVELMGHQRIAGRVTYQAGVLRVDVPQVAGQPAFTRLFGSSAVYSIIPTTEAIATAVAESLRAVPISRMDDDTDADNDPLEY